MNIEAVKNAISQMQEVLAGDLPEVSHHLERCEDIMVNMRDGIRLMTRVLVPNDKGPWPVLLVRNPYVPVNRDEYMSQPVFTLINYGYCIVYQQVRGLYDSEGEWDAFVNERNDGIDTVGWIKKQDWCNGSIGTYGGSYLGHVQWAMAEILPKEVKAMYFSVFGGDPYELFYENGMFKQGIWTVWATQMMDAQAVPTYGESDMARFEKAMSAVPHSGMDLELIGHRCPWYQNWIHHSNKAYPYWTEGFWKHYFDIAPKMKTPVLFQGGWFDIFIESGIRTFRRLNPKTRDKSRFVIGPWHHGNTIGGDLEYPNEDQMGVLQLKGAFQWFEHHLKGKAYPEATGVISAYGIGTQKWITLDCFDPRDDSSQVVLFLDGPIAGEQRKGCLVTQPAKSQNEFAYLYDPGNPVPTLGGNLLTDFAGKHPFCSVMHAEETGRDDILTFCSEPFAENFLICGRIAVYLSVETDAADTAFSVKVLEQKNNGNWYNIRDGITALGSQMGDAQYEPGSDAAIEISLTEIVWQIDAGSRLRLDISSSNYPAFHIHSNTDTPWSESGQYRVARQKLYTGGASGSRIEIPVLTD